MSDGRPTVGVGGAVVRDGRVLLIRRGKEPLRGRWVIPGGTVELGETLEQALVREMDEETGVLVEPLELLTVFDRIQREGERVVHHYVIVDYLCAWRGGEGRAGSDAEEARWVSPDELDRFDLPAKAREVVEEALRRSAGRTGGREALPPGGSRR